MNLSSPLVNFPVEKNRRIVIVCSTVVNASNILGVNDVRKIRIWRRLSCCQLSSLEEIEWLFVVGDALRFESI